MARKLEASTTESPDDDWMCYTTRSRVRMGGSISRSTPYIDFVHTTTRASITVCVWYGVVWLEYFLSHHLEWMSTSPPTMCFVCKSGCDSSFATLVQH